MNTTETTRLGRVARWAESGVAWGLGLLLRLGLVALVMGIVAIEAAVHSRGFSRLVPLLFPLVTAFAGVTWAVHHRLPFFRSRPEFQRWLIAGACSLLIMAITVPAMYLAMFLAVQQFETPSLAHFASPTNPGDEIRFYWVDDDLNLCVRPAGQRELMVTRLIEEGYGLSSIQWTKDGQVAVCTLSFRSTPDGAKTAETSTAAVIAYDFSTGQALVPDWISRGLGGPAVSDWRQAEAGVLALAAAHGGLDRHPIDSDELQRHWHPLWFWQKPEYEKP